MTTNAIGLMVLPPLPSILLIRRDNIGDLVLVAPLVRELRLRHPRAWIGVFGNTYNSPVLAGHPDIDEIFAYDKVKHRDDRSRLMVYADTARLLLRPRALHIDVAILAGPGPQMHAARLARWIRPRRVVGFVDRGRPRSITMRVEYGAGRTLHEAEDVFRLGVPLGVLSSPGPCVLAADGRSKARFAAALAGLRRASHPVVAVHVSARRELQRWPAERFAGFMRALQTRLDVLFVLLWAPGADDHPRHPGDDAKAAAIRALLDVNVDCLPWPTT